MSTSVPKGEEGLFDDPYDLLSRVTPEVQLLREVLPADTAQTTYARITLLGNKDLASAARSPLDAYLVLDHSRRSLSCSDDLDLLKTTALVILEALQVGDTCTVISCGRTARLISDSFVKGKTTSAEVERGILAMTLEEACDLTSAVIMAGWRAKERYEEARTSRIFVLGAGYAEESHGLAEVVKDLAKECVYTSVYAYGDTANAELLIAVANAGLGHFHRIKSIGQINDIVANEITNNSIAGKHVRLCIRPRHASVEVLELFNFEYIKEDDTLIVDVGDVYFRGVVDILLKMSFKCPPGRKDVLEVHVSHHDTNDDRHLRTFVLTGTFVIDSNEYQSAPAAPLVADKVMKVNTALALVLADQAAVNEGDITGALEILNSQVQRLVKAQGIGGTIIQTLQEDLKGYVAAYDETGVNLKAVRCTVLTHSRELYRA